MEIPPPIHSHFLYRIGLALTHPWIGYELLQVDQTNNMVTSDSTFMALCQAVQRIGKKEFRAENRWKVPDLAGFSGSGLCGNPGSPSHRLHWQF